jgi:hypothetical protein
MKKQCEKYIFPTHVIEGLSGSGGISPLIRNLGTRQRCVVSRRFYPRGKSRRYAYRTAGLDALKKGLFFALTKIRILSHPAGSLVIIPTTLSRNFGNVNGLVNDSMSLCVM